MTLQTRGGRSRTVPDHAPPRSPGVVLSAVAVVLVLLVGIVALTSRQPSPPTIAEFAPQAVEQITESPERLGFGTGAGGVERTPEDERPDATPGAAPSVDVARVRQCIGDPPRQIEDPQAPPCVPFWEGDNGGATSQGVTRERIRIVQSTGNASRWATFFNNRFEFYGRKLEIVPLGVPDGGDPAAQRSSAVKADDEHQAFAALTQVANGGYFYGEELARRRVLYSSTAPIFTEQHLRQRRPYLWQYQMTNDRMFGMLGELGCRQLVGQNARHAGDPLLAAQPRAFGLIVWESYIEWAVDGSPIADALARCGSEVKVSGRLLDFDYVAAENLMLQMRQQGVTSVYCLCNASTAWDMASEAATSQGYLPEWIISSYWSLDEWGRTTGTVEQSSHAFGLTTNPMNMRHSDEPYLWAAQGADPAYNDDVNDTVLGRWSQRTSYRSLLLLAAGIQMAGPRLTPETFERGLQRAVFPNPDHFLKAGKVGFGGAGGFDVDDHSMSNDASLFWMSPTDRGPYRDGGQGATCYVNAGARYDPGQLPSESAFFEPPCTAAAEQRAGG